MEMVIEQREGAAKTGIEASKVGGQWRSWCIVDGGCDMEMKLNEGFSVGLCAKQKKLGQRMKGEQRVVFMEKSWWLVGLSKGDGGWEVVVMLNGVEAVTCILVFRAQM
ncbi:unnamed protein product [Vicia faba]|uniref:Uncharacterized protein n=1 Tax=Vicia faba TaxID=3906 RepID=A0AAV1BAG0_VICFA|nr:unnamed protein product [Vicia faba]